MPIRLRVNSKRRLVTVIVEGKLTVQDVAVCIKQQQADPADSKFTQLVLISHRAAAMTVSEINDLAQVCNDLCPTNGNRCAIVSFTEVHYGQSRIFLSYRNSSADQLKVFRDVKEALLWLGVDSDAAIVEFEMAIALS
jgi:hypothetical protein|tara:strand:- start:923 stop:1336 length:414 start_codon:yes stop_codon:yes gene_type:complete